ncbi:MAG: L-histidine N(alpha)-methyltransferase, partial [Pseudomonadota bacterium]
MDDLYDAPAPDSGATFLRDVLAGLTASPKSLPCQYFYDETGSQLFEQITALPEYYPTRTETEILHAHAAQIAEALGDEVLLVEYGAGASTKTRILLEALNTLSGYVPIDVSEAFLLQTADQVRRDYPGLYVAPIV